MPIGSVNLTTGKLAKPELMSENIFEGWEPGGYNILIQDASRFRPDDYKRPFRVLHSSGDLNNGVKQFPIGGRLEICHDQTQRMIGEEWTVVGVFSHSQRGLLQLKEATGKGSLSFATFK